MSFCCGEPRVPEASSQIRQSQHGQVTPFPIIQQPSPHPGARIDEKSFRRSFQQSPVPSPGLTGDGFSSAQVSIGQQAHDSLLPPQLHPAPYLISQDGSTADLSVRRPSPSYSGIPNYNGVLKQTGIPATSLPLSEEGRMSIALDFGMFSHTSDAGCFLNLGICAQ